MITRDSRIKDLFGNPIARDVIDRLIRYAGVSEKLIDNPLVRGMKLSALPKLAGKYVDNLDGVIDTLIDLFNQEDGTKAPSPSNEPAWWKEAVIYQIYPRSFRDANGDGVGDILGVIEKLDYLQSLGVDAIWLSPIFDSPNDDNGYDVRDYRAIMAEFGTMADVERLIAELHARNMRLILDLVVNHTSDEHAWFADSLKGDAGTHADFYIWRKSEQENVPPNNWTSFFSGSAWTYYPERDAWALHLFSKKQMDLNWENPRVMDEVVSIINFWRGKGADGFRLDVINYISKTTLSDGNETLGALLGFTGVEHYFYGKKLHAYLHELTARGFGDAFTVGETPGTGAEMNRLLTAPERGELSTVFCFDHLENTGKNRFTPYLYDLNHLKKCFISYESDYADVAWPSIFVENHDNPRMTSKVDPTLQYRDTLAKLFAVLLLTARGTVFLYQGQELGAANVAFSDISELRDVESVNRYAELTQQGDADAWQRIKTGTRDHARTPMQWSSAENGGFSSHTPWIRMGDFETCNVEAQLENETSPLAFYRSMIALRHAHSALVYGSFLPHEAQKADLFCYFREDEKERFYIEVNLSSRTIEPPKRRGVGERVIGNYASQSAALRPYEANVYRAEK